MFEFKVAGPRELQGGGKPIYNEDADGCWTLDFDSLSQLISDDYDYLRSTHREDLGGLGKNVIKDARREISKAPGSALLDDRIQEWQTQILVSDALEALIEIIPVVKRSKSLLGISAQNVRKLVPMMNMQYQMRTDAVLPMDDRNCMLEGENETAKQIRQAYTKLMMFEK